jgi:hypothetical protein
VSASGALLFFSESHMPIVSILVTHEGTTPGADRTTDE